MMVSTHFEPSGSKRVENLTVLPEGVLCYASRASV